MRYLMKADYVCSFNVYSNGTVGRLNFKVFSVFEMYESVGGRACKFIEAEWRT